MKREYSVALIAIGSGILATALVFNFLKSSRPPGGEFVVALKDITKGQIIRQQDVGFSKLINQSKTKNLFLDIRDVAGQQAVKNIRKGTPVDRFQVTREISVASKKPLPIPQGMRALTISKKDMTSVPEFLEIGSYVDIIGWDSREKEMRTLVYSRQVISINPVFAAPMESITVALMPNEAETILAAVSLKPLQILVREDRAEERRMFAAPSGAIEIIRGIQKEGNVKK